VVSICISDGIRETQRVRRSTTSSYVDHLGAMGEEHGSCLSQLKLSALEEQGPSRPALLRRAGCVQLYDWWKRSACIELGRTSWI
jgi:hypothetical protein